MNKSPREPNEELGTSDWVFIMFCDDITSLVPIKTAVLIQKKLGSFAVTTAINTGISTTYKISEILQEKKGVGSRKLAVCTRTLVKFPSTNTDMMPINSGCRPHISMGMMPLGRSRELKMRVFMKLLSCTKSGTDGTEIVADHRQKSVHE